MLNEFLSTDLGFERELRKTLAQSFRRKKTVSQQIEVKNSQHSSRKVSQENSPMHATRKTGMRYIKQVVPSGSPQRSKRGIIQPEIKEPNFKFTSMAIAKSIQNYINSKKKVDTSLKEKPVGG